MESMQGPSIPNGLPVWAQGGEGQLVPHGQSPVCVPGAPRASALAPQL